MCKGSFFDKNGCVIVFIYHDFPEFPVIGGKMIYPASYPFVF
jgi:hypothetical protein